MNMQKIILVCCFLLSSCSFFNKQKTPILTDIPVKPELVKYNNGPILKKIDENYLVNKDLITNATLLTDYYKRIETWKELKNIK